MEPIISIVKVTRKLSTLTSPYINTKMKISIRITKHTPNLNAFSTNFFYPLVNAVKAIRPRKITTSIAHTLRTADGRGIEITAPIRNNEKASKEK